MQELKLYNAESIHLKSENGIIHTDSGLFTGRLFALNRAGDTVFTKEYRQGIEDGAHKAWYPNGQLQELRHYAAGKKTGINTGYWPNGTNRYQYHFVNDLYEGLQYEWYSTYKPYSKKTYLHGYEQGLQQTWNADGSIRSNYEAKNGRNYGNIGKKNCYSEYKNAAFYSLP